MMNEQDNRLLIERYLAGLLDAQQEYALRHEDVVIDMPQSGERIRGRDHMKAMQEAYPGPPTITVRRVVGNGDVWVVEARSNYSGRIYHITNILEFREGKIIRETRYYADPFEAPAWRAQWVESIEEESRTGKMASDFEESAHSNAKNLSRICPRQNQRTKNTQITTYTAMTR